MSKPRVISRTMLVFVLTQSEKDAAYRAKGELSGDASNWQERVCGELVELLRAGAEVKP